MPYWDSTLDEALPDPNHSILWNEQIFGKNLFRNKGAGLISGTLFEILAKTSSYRDILDCHAIINVADSNVKNFIGDFIGEGGKILPYSFK